MNISVELEKIFSTEFKQFPKMLEKKKIVLYGAGSLGEMACDLLNRAGIGDHVTCIVDNIKTGKLKNFNIVRPEAISDLDKSNCIFLICVATVSYNSIEVYLKKLNIKHIMHFYPYAYIRFSHLLSNGWYCKELSNIEKSKIEKICEFLAHDENSLHHYLQFLWWKLKNVEFIYKDFPVLSGQKYFTSPCMPRLNQNEILLDCGCHHGQTIKSFVKFVHNKYTKIYAAEPDVENLSVCKIKFTDERIIYLPFAISDETKKLPFNSKLGFASRLDVNGNEIIESVSIDDLNINPTIIKLHVEGEELNALKGAVKTIRNNNPILMVSADHSYDGLYKIAEHILRLEDYKLFFYLNDYCGNTAIFYGIPKHRRYQN